MSNAAVLRVGERALIVRMPLSQAGSITIGALITLLPIAFGLWVVLPRLPWSPLAEQAEGKVSWIADVEGDRLPFSHNYLMRIEGGDAYFDVSSAGEIASRSKAARSVTVRYFRSGREQSGIAYAGLRATEVRLVRYDAFDVVIDGDPDWRLRTIRWSVLTAGLMAILLPISAWIAALAAPEGWKNLRKSVWPGRERREQPPVSTRLAQADAEAARSRPPARTRAKRSSIVAAVSVSREAQTDTDARKRDAFLRAVREADVSTSIEASGTPRKLIEHTPSSHPRVNMRCVEDRAPDSPDLFELLIEGRALLGRSFIGNQPYFSPDGRYMALLEFAIPPERRAIQKTLALVKLDDDHWCRISPTLPRYLSRLIGFQDGLFYYEESFGRSGKFYRWTLSLNPAEVTEWQPIWPSTWKP